MERIRKYIAKACSLNFYIITLLILLIAVGCIQVEPNVSGQTCECGSTMPFEAIVRGLQNKEVSWSIVEGDEWGTITGEGLYTAPDELPSPSTATVKATSVANPKISGTAVVNLIGGPSNIGELGGPCYTDGTCNSGLICVDDICEKEDPEDPAVVINNNIQNLIILEQEEPLEDPEPIEGSAECENPEPTYYCSTEKYKAAPEYNEQICLDPGSDVIWIGSILDGETIPTGEYTPITAKRGPLTFSVSLENIGGSPSKTVDEASLSNIRNGMQEILSQNVTGSTAAYISFIKEQIYSEQQLKVAVGASYKSGFANVSANFDFENQSIQTRILVKFIQKYYTVDIDIPEKPSDFFAPSVNWEELEAQITGTTSPMYVSSISFGRMALFSLESTQNYTEIEAELNTAFKVWGGDASIDVKTAWSNLLEHSTIKATIIGGSGADAVGAINGFEGLLTYIEEGGDYSADSPGAPLAYKLRYLSNNSIGNIVMATEYTVRNCTRIANEFTVRVKTLECLCSCDGGNEGDPEEWYGWARAAAVIGDDPPDPSVVVMDYPQSSAPYLRMTSGETYNVPADRFATATIKLNLNAAENQSPLDARLMITSELIEYDAGGGNDDTYECRPQYFDLFRLTDEGCPVPQFLGLDDPEGILRVSVDDYYDPRGTTGTGKCEDEAGPIEGRTCGCCSEGSMRLHFEVTPTVE